MPQKRLPVMFAALLLSVLIYGGTLLFLQPARTHAAAYHAYHTYNIQEPLNAYVISSNPTDGSTVNTAPTQVRIFFNMPISPLSSAHVYAIQAGGNKIEINASSSYVSPGNANELDTPLKTPASLPQGSYEVTWSAIGTNDGRTTFGLIGFNVGYSGLGIEGNVIQGPSTSNNIEAIHQLDFMALLSIAWEWLTFIALTFWIGLIVIERFLLVRERDSHIPHQARAKSTSLESLCLLVMLFGEIIAFVIRITRFIQAPGAQTFSFSLILGMLTQTTYGYLWLIRICLLLIALAFFYRVQRRDKHTRQENEYALSGNHASEQQEVQAILTDEPATSADILESEPIAQKKQTRIWLFLASLITLTYALTSSVSSTLIPHISAIIISWLAMVSLGIWVGGLTYLAYILLPILKSTDVSTNAETRTTILSKLTPVLLSSMCVWLVSDVFLSEASITNPQQLLTDPFGRTLIVQIVLAVIAVLLSLYALLVIRPRYIHQELLLPVSKAQLPTRQTRQSRLRDTGNTLTLTTKLLAFCGAAILLCSALQSFFAPPISFPTPSTSKNVLAPQQSTSVAGNTQKIGDMQVALQLLPTRAGVDHTVVLIITNSQGLPVTGAQVTVTTNMVIMDMGIQHATLQGNGPTYVTTIKSREAFDMAGAWKIAVTIQRPGQTAVSGTFNVMLTS